jgi:hypothetical protein
MLAEQDNEAYHLKESRGGRGEEYSSDVISYVKSFCLIIYIPVWVHAFLSPSYVKSYFDALQSCFHISLSNCLRGAI